MTLLTTTAIPPLLRAGRGGGAAPACYPPHPAKASHPRGSHQSPAWHEDPQHIGGTAALLNVPESLGTHTTPTHNPERQEFTERRGLNGKSTRETTELLFRRAKDEGRQTPQAIIHSKNTRESPALSAGPWSAGSLGEEQIAHLSLPNASSALHHGVMDICCKQATPAWCNAAVPLQSPAAHAQSLTSQGTDHNGAPERAPGLHQASSRGGSECSSCSAGGSSESSCFWKGCAQEHHL